MWTLAFSRLTFFLGIGSAIVGIVAALTHHTWRLGALGWLLLALVGVTASIAVVVEALLRTGVASKK